MAAEGTPQEPAKFDDELEQRIQDMVEESNRQMEEALATYVIRDLVEYI